MYICCGRRPPSRLQGLATAAERQWASQYIIGVCPSVCPTSIDAETTEARELNLAHRCIVTM
ncbi:Hypothetical protein FKW44_006649 [Caligus rogercresseyi]|uniref:Uncharacterized protein n=1 Tax=Caligus rogercresseyi TaxID=217165 RepID=A0A7T8KDL6_CALRO|nr:Hypothetical protein FKW44_006649 [Caligus rogercresseyi]